MYNIGRASVFVMPSFHLEIPQQGDGCQVTEQHKRHGLEKSKEKKSFLWVN
jgi:hypothetical protein